MIWLRLLPYIAGIAAIIGAAAFVYDAGYDARDKEAIIEKAEAVQNAIKQAEEQRKKDLDLAEESAKVEIKTRTVYKTIYKEAENVQSNCSDVGNDFIRVYNDAIKAASKTTSTE